MKETGMQSRKESAIEAVVNIAIGMGVALGSQYLVFPIVGMQPVSHEQHIYITLWFTAISFARSYIIRRWFATRMSSVIHKIAGE
jgi:hypothetical protein